MKAKNVNTELGLYVKETLRHHLLDEKEELELAERMERARNAYDLLLTGKLNLQEYEHLQDIARKAREQLIQANLRLVISIAKRFQKSGAPLDDLVFEGNVGLLHAAERFKSGGGARFSTYATFYISQSMMTFLSQRHLISAPTYVRDLVPAMRKAIDTLSKRNEDPTPENIAKEMDISVAKVVALSRLDCKCISLDNADEDNDESHSRTSNLADFRNKTVEEAVAQNIDDELTLERLSTLSTREAQILRLYYGVETGDRMTLKEVGERIGLTRERIRQIKREAIEKLQAAFPEE